MLEHGDATPPRGWLTRWLDQAARTARMTVGLPDYETYVSHRRQSHPNEPIMSYEEFFRDRQVARYARGASRCC